MKVKVTKENVVIVECSSINQGEFNVNTCEFVLPEIFLDLQVTAAFNNIPVPVVDGKCIIPNLNKGTATLGVYAYKEQNDGVELMYSPKPTSFYVENGSYSIEIGNEEKLEISEFEKYCRVLCDYVDNSKKEILGEINDVSALIGGAE